MTKKISEIRDTTLKAVLKYCNHPSLSAIKEKAKSGSFFVFNHITKEATKKEIKDLDVSKPAQVHDIPTKVMKKNTGLFSNFIYPNFDKMIYVCIFSASLKLASITPVSKARPGSSKEKHRHVIKKNVYQKFTKGVYLNKCQTTLKISFKNFSMALDMVSVHSIS